MEFFKRNDFFMIAVDRFLDRKFYSYLSKGGRPSSLSDYNNYNSYYKKMSNRIRWELFYNKSIGNK